MNYFLTYSVYVLILSVLMGVSTWKLFKKMGYNPLFAFVPFYNYMIVQKETKHPKWWAFLAYLPIVGPSMMSVFPLFLMKKFGKTLFKDKILTVILPFIYMAIVNYSANTEIEEEDDQYLTEEERKAKKKDTFLGSVTFAVVFATIIHTFITQPFGIPTGSMERTLLVGDFLFVNKLNYGFRMPMRPLAIPFIQSTIFDTGEKGNPKDDPKSYADGVSLPYFRLPGWEKPERNDIVVFNYPGDSVHTSIDRKDPYVKRLVAAAGETVEFRNGEMFVNGQPEKRMGDAEVQHAYNVVANQMLDIDMIYNAYGFLPVNVQDLGNGSYNYRFSGLTDKFAKEFKELQGVVSITQDIRPKGEKDISYYPDMAKSQEAGKWVFTNKVNVSNTIFPNNKDWNIDWYGPLRVPKKGDVVTLTADNLPECQKIITEYEGNTLETKNGQFLINGTPAKQYTVKYDYYMMIGDNRDASLDSRFFGFVPETHVVGKPMFTWLSLEGVFADSNSDFQAPKKKIRWERMFKATNTGDANKASYWWVAVIILVLFFGWDYFEKLFKKKKED